MNKSDLKALGKLLKNQTMTVKQADKGGAAVVWNTVDYIDEANRQLRGTHVYKSLDRDPKWEISLKIQRVVD